MGSYNVEGIVGVYWRAGAWISLDLVAARMADRQFWSAVGSLAIVRTTRRRGCRYLLDHNCGSGRAEYRRVTSNVNSRILVRDPGAIGRGDVTTDCLQHLYFVGRRIRVRYSSDHEKFCGDARWDDRYTPVLFGRRLCHGYYLPTGDRECYTSAHWLPWLPSLPEQRCFMRRI